MCSCKGVKVYYHKIVDADFVIENTGNSILGKYERSHKSSRILSRLYYTKEISGDVLQIRWTKDGYWTLESNSKSFAKLFENAACPYDFPNSEWKVLDESEEWDYASAGLRVKGLNCTPGM